MMFLRPMLILISLTIACYVSVATASTEDKPPFYQLSYQGKTAYLMGSIHVGRDDFYPLPHQIQRFFEHADALVLEADVSQADTLGLIKKYGVQPAPMDAETAPVMAKYCENKAALCQALQSYSPWLQATQVEMMRFAQMGYQAEQGIEMYLMANRGNKQILELESTEFQFGLLASFSLDTQWEMLRDAITSSDDEMMLLVDAWRKGDEAGLAAMMQEKMEPDDTEFVAKILWDRNRGMADRIVALLADDGTPQMFIAVGALHLVGEKSLPDYLRARGVELTQCWQDKCQ